MTPTPSPMPTPQGKPGVPMPQVVCRGNPCWCNQHPEKGAPRSDGRQPWSQEGQDRFMRERFKQHGQKASVIKSVDEIIAERKGRTPSQRILHWVSRYTTRGGV